MRNYALVINSCSAICRLIGITNLGQGGQRPKLKVKLAEGVVAEPQSSWSVGVKGLEDWEGSRVLGGKNCGSIAGPMCADVGLGV